LNTKGKIYSINISEQKGVKKNPVDKARISNGGIEGDGHKGNWHRQVSLLSLESILSFNSLSKLETKPGEFGENITTSGIDLKQLKIGDRLMILKPDADFSDVITGEEFKGKKELQSKKDLRSREELNTKEELDSKEELGIKKEFYTSQNFPESSVILEVTQIGKECLTPCRIFYEVGRCIMPAEGIFFKVIKTGEIKPGDNIIFL
jgi:MOSC domain-containing protein YiiM